MTEEQQRRHDAIAEALSTMEGRQRLFREQAELGRHRTAQYTAKNRNLVLLNQEEYAEFVEKRDSKGCVLVEDEA